jgi:hypothetical protein
VTPDALVLNRTQPGALSVTLSEVRPAGAATSLGAPEGWRLTRDGSRIGIAPPGDVAPGLHAFTVEVDGAPAATVRRIAHPHVAPTLSAAPARLRLAVLDAALPPVRIGYVGAGNDRVGHWLRAIGFDVTDVDDAALAGERPFDGLDTVVVGIFAFRFRPGLLDAVPALHDWVAAGGKLVTLYHRPWDNWDPDRVPPRRLEIGQPSLRWRVTDEAAEVRHLVPDHPLLSTPNRIGPDDWAGWVKERGLYFAKAWDDAYVPLLEMADPGEAPQRGALLAADIGRGRHVHTSLILHHQMEHLVPGAFRLMANLVASRR